MKKLSLNLDALRVESFDTSAGGASRLGTVRGNDSRSLTFTETLVGTTTDPNLNCMCHSSDPCVNTLPTACAPECEV
jgi:hypothetical protein